MIWNIKTSFLILWTYFALAYAAQSPEFDLVASKPGWKYDKSTVSFVKEKLFLDHTSSQYFRGIVSEHSSLVLAKSAKEIAVGQDFSLSISKQQNGTREFTLSPSYDKLLYKGNETFSACLMSKFRPAFQLFASSIPQCPDGTVPEYISLIPLDHNKSLSPEKSNDATNKLKLSSNESSFQSYNTTASGNSSLSPEPELSNSTINSSNSSGGATQSSGSVQNSSLSIMLFSLFVCSLILG